MTARPPNPYLDGLPDRGVLVSRQVLGVWLPLAMAIGVLSALAVGPREITWLMAELIVLVVALVFVARGRARRHAAEREGNALVAIERHVLREDHDGARDAIVTMLARPVTAFDRARALHQLGQVAEARADFAEAAEVYARALEVLPRRRGVFGMAYAQLAPVLGARRAFCLAAAGRLDEAQTVLDAAHDRDEHPGVRALAVRARALLLARRGQHQELLELASREHVRIKNGLPHRDRKLLEVLLGWGRSCVGGAFRAPPSPGLGEDRALRAWIARAVPEAAAVVGGP